MQDITVFSKEIEEYLGSLFGSEAVNKYADILNADIPQYIRVNTLRISRDDLIGKLSNYGITAEPVPELPNALKISGGSNLIGKTVEHLIGLYYIQSLSSMIPPYILNPQPGEKVLDLCAAPGSKTTALAEYMQNRGTLIANEIQGQRVSTLIFNLDRMNTVNTGVIHTRGEWLSKNYDGYFDKVLVDVPCSGLGIMQKKGEVSNWWSLNRVENLFEIQYKLLMSAVKMTKTGGEIIYSTCTLTVEENEMLVDKILGKLPVDIEKIDIPVIHRPGFTSYKDQKFDESLSGSRRILPWESDTEGFFLVKLIKTNETTSPESAKPGKKDFTIKSYEQTEDKLKEVRDSFGIPADRLSEFNYIFAGSNIFFVRKETDLPESSIFKRIGLKAGVFNKKGQIVLTTPAARLLSDDITENIFEIETTDQLLTYLQGGIIKGAGSKSRQVTIMYDGMIMGTAVAVHNGIKSRFPRVQRTQDFILP